MGDKDGEALFEEDVHIIGRNRINVREERWAMLYDYGKGRWYKVRVKGKECLFNDYRIDRDTVPVGKFMYEVADDCDATPIRIRSGIMINFYGTIVSDEPLALDASGTAWLGDADWEWVVD